MLKDKLSQYPEIYNMIAHCGQCYIQPIFGEDKLWLVAENSMKIGRIQVARELNLQILNEIDKLTISAEGHGFMIIPRLPTVEPLNIPTISWTIEDQFTKKSDYKLHGIQKIYHVHTNILKPQSDWPYTSGNERHINFDDEIIMAAIRMIYQLPQEKVTKMDYEKLYKLFKSIGFDELSKKCKNMMIEEKNYLALLRLNLI